jgi:DNA-binding NarL/FixJ family response regulator
MSLKGTGLEGDYAPDHPLNQHDDNRLTKRGIEICYRLFDLGKSDMAIAHLMRLSLEAVKARKKLWLKLGGKKRPTVNLEDLPRRRRGRRR